MFARSLGGSGEADSSFGGSGSGVEAGSGIDLAMFARSVGSALATTSSREDVLGAGASVRGGTASAE
jgi:hypothetical protein